jgi:hypothetical protein
MTFDADGKTQTALVGKPISRGELADGAMTRTYEGAEYAIYIRFGVALADAPYEARKITPESKGART